MIPEVLYCRKSFNILKTHVRMHACIYVCCRARERGCASERGSAHRCGCKRTRVRLGVRVVVSVHA